MQFLLDNPDLMLYHNEPILKNGEIVGHLTSGTYSHTLGSAVGLGYITCKPNERYEDIVDAESPSEIEGAIEKCTVSLKTRKDTWKEKIKIKLIIKEPMSVDTTTTTRTIQADALKN